MISAFTLTNINTKIIEGKLKKIFISEVCINYQTSSLRINDLISSRYTKSSSQFQNGW